MPDAPRTLEAVQIQSPCTVPWESMNAVDRDGAVRYCGECRQNVFDLSQMSRRDGEALLRDRTGRTCVRMLRRDDGTVVTDECGPLRRAVRRRTKVLRMAGAALLTMLFPGALAGCRGRSNPPAAGGIAPAQPASTQGETCLPTMGKPAVPQTPSGVEMGDVRTPPPAETPKAPETAPEEPKPAPHRESVGRI